MKKLFFIFLLLSACANPGNFYSERASSPPDQRTVEALGIELIALRLTANGQILDFRYKALHPEKTAVLFRRDIKPYLIHEESGKTFAVPAPPKVGPLRQTTNKPVAGKHYFMLFANPGKFIQHGDRVTLVHGEYRIEGLVVE